ncbi:hypothetical protein [Anaeromyxobacter sp. Fw109-5]|uniref:hypothetical protein n=1 Tax=Anaeromyxobacter sp. (strain Fw109-5) TaxID=404589 RepID=UPI00117F15AA|nr:hypothetical protein [Anaeromyxobacter sp. Fw109-5]
MIRVVGASAGRAATVFAKGGNMAARSLKLAAFATTLFVSAGAWGAPSHVNDLPRALERKVHAVTKVLEHRGYEVARGYWKTFGIDDCQWAIDVMGNCLGNNPTAPYILPVLPLWRDEYVDATTRTLFGPVPRRYAATYRLAEREAIVILAKLPPEGAYFGVQSYVFTRAGAIDTSDEVYQWLDERFSPMVDLLFDTAPDPSRVVVFSSIGDANNHIVMAGRGEPPWDQERFIVVTPDESMQEAVNAALHDGADIPAQHVFVEPVAPELVRLGLHSSADDLLTIVRYALPKDEVAGDLWRQELPLAVLRVRDMKAPDAIRPYATPAYDARSAISEQPLRPALDALVPAVIADWGSSPGCAKPFTPFIVPYLDVDLIGQHCLERPMNCLGDTLDTDTYRISPQFSLDPSPKAVAVVGALATATGNATYVSMSVNRQAVMEGVKNLSQLDLARSAAAFGVPGGDKLYAFYLARRCPAGKKAPCFEIAEADVPANEVINLIQRNYIKPGTARGADPGEAGAETLLRPRLIWLDPGDCPP